MTHDDYVHYLLLLAGDGVIVDSRYEGGTTENAEIYLQILLECILHDADFASLHTLAQRLIAKYKDGEYFLIAHEKHAIGAQLYTDPDDPSIRS